MSVLESLAAADAASRIASVVLVRATAVCLLGAVALRVLRGASASVRHAALFLTVAALLALPVFAGLLPRWELAVLSAPPPAAPALVSPAFTTPAASAPDAPSTPARRPTRPAADTPALAIVEPEIPPPAANPDAAGWDIREVPVAAWFLLVWGAGLAVGLLRLLLATRFVRRTVRSARALADARWRRDLDEVRAYLGLERRVRLVSSPAVAVPLVHGDRDATVMLPADAESWPEDRRRAFLLHELAHVRRHDWLTQTVAHLVSLLYWPNPLAWWVVRRLRAEAERACDDRVLSAGTSPSDYAAHLLEAARELSRARRPLGGLAVVERSRLEDRLLALLDPALRRGLLTARGLALGVFLSGAVAGSIAALEPVARAEADAPTLPPVGRDAAEPSASLATRPSAVAAEPRSTRTPAAPAHAPTPPTRIAASEGGPEQPPPTHEGSPAPTHLPVVPAGPGDAFEVATTGGVSTDPGTDDPQMESASPQAAPTPPPAVPVIRISTEVVQIDAVVTDKAGRHVVDLQPEDFELFENGRRQALSHLVYVKTGQGPTTEGPAAVAVGPQTASPRTLLFVVDDLGLSLQSIDRTRRLLTAFARTRLQQSDRVALVTTGQVGTHPLPLSLEPSALAAAAAGLRYNLWSRSAFARLEPRRLGEVGAYGPAEANWASLRAIDSVGGLKATIDGLRAVPGRKAVIFLSEGFVILTSNDTSGLVRGYTSRPLDTLYDDTNLRAALRSLIDLANRASVVVYTIDPSGLTTDSSGASAADLVPGASAPANASRGDISTSRAELAFNQRRALLRQGAQDSLIEIAEETGGLAIYSQNDLSRGLDRILDDHAGYYLMGYAPDASTFSSASGHIPFHKVKVRVRRPGLTVRSRKGFYGVSDDVVARTAPPIPLPGN